MKKGETNWTVETPITPRNSATFTIPGQANKSDRDPTNITNEPRGDSFVQLGVESEAMLSNPQNYLKLASSISSRSRVQPMLCQKNAKKTKIDNIIILCK